MAKVVMMPRTRTVLPSRTMKVKSCSYQFEEGTLRFDCSGCSAADEAPDERCLAMFRKALEANLEANNILLQGTQDVWLREKGVGSLRSLISAELSWEDFRSTVRSLRCHNTLAPDRITKYLERCREGRLEMFCAGEGSRCNDCLRIQEGALDLLRSDRRRARRNVAADRFRIVEVPGEGSR